MAKIDSNLRLWQSLASRFSIEWNQRQSGSAPSRLKRSGSLAHYLLQGALPLATFDSLRVPVAIRVNPDWWNQPPDVICTEFWVRKEADWHVNDNGTLCWVLGNQWRDTISIFDQKSSSSGVCDAASFFLIRNVTYLLNCHRMGHEKAARDWDPSWSAFLHGSLGVDQYKLESEEIRGQELDLLEKHEQ